MSHYNEVQPKKFDPSQKKKKKSNKNSLGFNPNSVPVGGASSGQFDTYNKPTREYNDDENYYEREAESLAKVESFVTRSFERAANLTDQKQARFNDELNQILEIAKAQGKLETNDWAHQRVPILDGGGILELECDRVNRKKKKDIPASAIEITPPITGSPLSSSPPISSIQPQSSQVYQNQQYQPSMYRPMYQPAQNQFYPPNPNLQIQPPQYDSQYQAPPSMVEPIPTFINSINVEKFSSNEQSSFSTPYNQGFGQFQTLDPSSAPPPPPPPPTSAPSIIPYVTEKRSGYGDYDSVDRKKQRLARFESSVPDTITNQTERTHPTNTNGAIVGRSRDLEKTYLRLTAAPDPNKVRPQSVLEKSLTHIFSKYESNKKMIDEKRIDEKKMDQKKNYSYIINQFKSIRQDLTVQHIKNDFAIVVYVRNAIVSLENLDLGEFNQCQTQLKHLYQLRRKADSTFERKFQTGEVELQLYKLIYMMHTKNLSEIVRMRLLWKTEFISFRKINNEEKFFKLMDSLYKANDYILNGNYYRFFKELHRYQQDKTFYLAFKIIHHFLYGKIRIEFLDMLIKSYNKIPISLIQDCLDFKSEDKCLVFLTSDVDLKNALEGNEVNTTIAKPIMLPIISKMKKVDIKGQI